MAAHFAKRARGQSIRTLEHAIRGLAAKVWGAFLCCSIASIRTPEHAIRGLAAKGCAVVQGAEPLQVHLSSCCGDYSL